MLYLAGQQNVTTAPEVTVQIKFRDALAVRDKVQQYLVDDGMEFAQGDPTPTLYDHEHEGLSRGCWTIVFECTEVADWPFKFSEAIFKTEVEIPWSITTEAQSAYALNLYPYGE